MISGFDFNPTVDRIRIVSDTGQNLRVNPNDGAAVADGALNPGTPSITAAAYTNSFNGATATTLYDIDSATDTLLVQNQPNAGTLVPVGALGVDASEVNGFDIFAGDDGTAYAAMTVNGGATNLYTINLTSGAATQIGAIGGGSAGLRGLSAEIGLTPGLLAVGLTAAGNNLVVFNTARPSAIIRAVAVTGLQAGENLLGIDFRPATGQLYGLGSASRLYVINLQTGAATAVGAAGAFTLSGTDFGFDFNPTVDRIRVVSNTGQNLRLNPNDGSLAATDGNLNPGAPSVTGAAYTNSFPGAASTTLYDIDTNSDRLLIQNPPNAGTLVDVGPLGFDAAGVNGFDIAVGSSAALAALQVGNSANSNLYAINLATGAAAFIGPVGGGATLRGLAIFTGSAASGGTAAALDFDGDRRADFGLFRLSNNFWYVLPNNAGGAFFGVQFGLGGSDILTPGDYDGDGRADAAVFRPNGGFWYVLRSSDSQVESVQFGQNGDQPVPRDYDGDGRTDFAVVRRENGQIYWFILNSANGSFRAEQFGLASDRVAPGDYDGDGRFDLAVRRGAGGDPAVFYIQQSTRGFTARQWGIGGDAIAPGDYDGDGKTDFAVIREGSEWTWFVLQSSDDTYFAVQFGAKGQFAAPADYDGDGRTDVATYDPFTGAFYYLRSSDGAFTARAFGRNGDFPIAVYNSF